MQKRAIVMLSHSATSLVSILEEANYASGCGTTSETTQNRACISHMLKRSSTTFEANGRNDHVTMFILHLPLAVFSFSEKLSSFALELKARIILYYFHLRTRIFKNLTFAVCRKRSLVSPSRREPTAQLTHAQQQQVCSAPVSNRKI